MKLQLEDKISTHISLKNILFATDFSAVSEAALPYVSALSERYGSKIHVVHALPETAFARPSTIDPVLFGTIYEGAHSDAQEKVQELSARLQGFPHQTYVRHGNVCDVLSQIIREQEIDLLVAGTHGRTGVGKLLMGSVAEEILRQVPCPVFTVGPLVANKAAVPAGSAEHEKINLAAIDFRQIVYATNFTPHSLTAANYALSLAKEFRARLLLLHVMQEYGQNLHDWPRPIEAAFHKLEELVPKDSGLRHKPEPAVEFGTPADCILRTATECRSDLIVLGVCPSDGHLGAATHLPGATAHKVIARANCPVLTVRG